jgi:hypothetical protein
MCHVMKSCYSPKRVVVLSGWHAPRDFISRAASPPPATKRNPPRSAVLLRLVIGQPREARLEVREHDLQRRRPPLVPVERKRNLPPVN